ncbi:helicase associated domain-containing protein [Streptomyces sp. NPDC054962]
MNVSRRNLAAAKAYYEEHWTLCAPRTATVLDRPVGQWLSNLRRPGALDGHPGWKAALDAVDEDWNPVWPADWQRHYAALRDEQGLMSCLTSPSTALDTYPQHGRRTADGQGVP